jgi:ribosomal protein S18 acetylase RimI-like enzyme
VSTIDYALCISPFPSDLHARLSELIRVIFGEADDDDLAWRLSRLPDASVVTAVSGTLLVGFKFGYAETSRRYYSWLGGVHPDFRQRGIASCLMEQQHRWVAAAGFAAVETSATPDNAAMLRLNQRFGFETIGTYARRGPRVLMSKRLVTS